MANVSAKVDDFMQKIVDKNPGQEEHHQAVGEMAESIMPS